MDILQFYLVIIRRVNANASPDVPKPLYQWGGFASPLIQSFGCTDMDDQLKQASAEIFLVNFLTSLNDFLVKMRQLFRRRGAADPR